MVIIWLMMVNNNLVGGAMCPSWKMMEFVNGKDCISHIWPMENKSHVWNHQADFFWKKCVFFFWENFRLMQMDTLHWKSVGVCPPWISGSLGCFPKKKSTTNSWINSGWENTQHRSRSWLIFRKGCQIGSAEFPIFCPEFNTFHFSKSP